jgi:protease-4
MSTALNYPRLVSKVLTSMWAATPETPQAIFDLLRTHTRHGGGERAADAPKKVITDATGAIVGIGPAPDTEAAPGPVSVVNGVAVVKVHGIIDKHPSKMETMCGARGVDEIAADISACMDRTDVTAIVLDIDSPGGTVTGVPELAAKIRAWAPAKMISGYSSSQACSAAYYLMAACTEASCSPTAVVGSIGVYIPFVDSSARFEAEGYRLHLIKAGIHKGAGIPGLPLADSARAAMQADVDAVYAMFTEFVSTARPEVTPETMQGQVFRGQAALVAGLVDEILPDLAAAVQAAADRVAGVPKNSRALAVGSIPGTYFLNTPTGRAEHAKAQARAESRALATSSVPSAGPAKPSAPAKPATAAKSTPPAPAPAESAKINLSASRPPATPAEAFATYGALNRTERTAYYQKFSTEIWQGYASAGRRPAAQVSAPAASPVTPAPAVLSEPTPPATDAEAFESYLNLPRAQQPAYYNKFSDSIERGYVAHRRRRKK